EQLDHDKMATNTDDKGYDTRAWAQGYALEFLCLTRARKMAGAKAKDVDQWITRLVQTLVEEEIHGGGWNYSGRSHPATFVTAPLTQALLLARSQGEKVPDKIFARARDVLERARTEDGGFGYTSFQRNEDSTVPEALANMSSVPGSVGRTAVCETTLVL